MTNIQDAKIVSDVRLFAVAGISAKCGRKALEALEAEGAVSPLRTPTGRTFLSQREAETVLLAVSRPKAA